MQKNVGSNLGTVQAYILNHLLDAIQYVRRRSKKFRSDGSQPTIRTLLTEFNDTITICQTRLSSGSSSFRDLQRGVVELQRACLYTLALLDYLAIFHPRILSEEQPTHVADRMGAFVWNDRDALLLYRAGLPTYHVRHYSDFHAQNILETTELIAPNSICTAAAIPPYPIIYTGQAGADEKFSAIRTASIRCFSGENPFENMHLPGAYQSSYEIGVSSIVSSTRSAPSLPGPSRTVASHVIASSLAPYPKTKAQRMDAKKQNTDKGKEKSVKL
ncbi:hypothetical protein D9758_000429 [Tetrapyrgos nigripes]|uniref:Uncharacterized protein n=1 Tax=Tetrapyrgos nigripes TaxID=182062 RepID=A0A8H5H0X8_9AGAR|nr:hypothetical protein D9758_000429 [Tetrapyrgos nigripes]